VRSEARLPGVTAKAMRAPGHLPVRVNTEARQIYAEIGAEKEPALEETIQLRLGPSTPRDASSHGQNAREPPDRRPELGSGDTGAD
jgi:hypothetical protein